MVPALLAAALMAGSSPPDLGMLEAFKAACIRTGDIGAMKADALASGWEEVAEDVDPRLAKLNRVGREGVDDSVKLSGSNFRATVAGRQLFLIQSRVDDRKEGYWGAGCRVYDFDATVPIDPALLESWMGRKPTGVEELGEGLGRRLWEPGWGPVSVNASHIPAGHPLGARFGPQGNVLVAQAIGGF